MSGSQLVSREVESPTSGLAQVEWFKRCQRYSRRPKRSPFLLLVQARGPSKQPWELPGLYLLQEGECSLSHVKVVLLASYPLGVAAVTVPADQILGLQLLAEH